MEDFCFVNDGTSTDWTFRRMLARDDLPEAHAHDHIIRFTQNTVRQATLTRRIRSSRQGACMVAVLFEQNQYTRVRLGEHDHNTHARIRTTVFRPVAADDT